MKDLNAEIATGRDEVAANGYTETEVGDYSITPTSVSSLAVRINSYSRPNGPTKESLS